MTHSAAYSSQMGAQPATRAQGYTAAALMLAAVFFVIMILSVALVKLGPSRVPLRLILVFGVFGMLSLMQPAMLRRAINDVLPVLVLIGCFAMIGSLASILNGAILKNYAQQVLEIQIQAAINLIVGAYLVRICGIRLTVMAYAGAIAISSLFALAQFAEISPAWAVREALQRFQGLSGTSADNVFLTQRLRAMGLSLTPVHLGTQICLAFAACYIGLVARYGTARPIPWNWQLIAVVVAFVVIAVASGNRSPLIGIIAFVGLHLFRTNPGAALLMLVVAAPALTFGDEMLAWLEDFGLRVARTEDGSSAGRAVLRAYGWQLFLDQPYGYGLNFQSVEHWPAYIGRYLEYENYMAITIHALHNYFLQVLNKYGALAIPLAAWVVVQMLRFPQLSIGFVPYIAHIYFHNDGPFQGDFMIWFIMPAYFHISRIMGKANG
jgi:hypothetical protein